VKLSAAIKAQLKRSIGPTAVLASGLVSPLAWSAPGDLDPEFGDVGRALLPDLTGPAWSVEAADDDDLIAAGGDFAACDFYCYWYSYDLHTSGFASRLSADGSLDPSFAAPELAGIEVLDIALQPDGKVIGAGRSVHEAHTQLTVFRLERDGALDTSFGDGGIVNYSSIPDVNHKASAVVLDPDGDIVVAGVRGSELIVLRLLPTGEVDSAFGDLGLFVGSSASPSVGENNRPQVLRTAGGGYRVTNDHFITRGVVEPQLACRVIGLTSSGALDSAFGDGGIADVHTGFDLSIRCGSMVEHLDGGLLVAGTEGARGFAIRLLDSGARDTGFAASAVAETIADATAVAVRDDGSMLVAGRPFDSVTGAVIVRLQASGELDPLFGNLGTTRVDLEADFGSAPVVRDIKLLSDGGALLAGGDESAGTSRPFVARLIGDDGRAGPGVVGVMHSSVVATEEGGQAVVTVRRAGGASGEVSVAYSTNPHSASAGQDYTAVADLLHWADGDAADQQIIVPIAVDGAAEFPEQFDVVLTNPLGGAALGSSAAVVEIAAAGNPGGLFGMELSASRVHEGNAVQVTVRRDYYALGDVSVTLRATAGTATSEDFDTDPITISWPDGDTGARVVSLAITEDVLLEQDESFTVALEQPTGGAVVGPLSSASITIDDDDALPEPGGGGGGKFGWLSLLLLGATGLARVLRRTVR
jgi:uncharacterized delta-60 repeat protein